MLVLVGAYYLIENLGLLQAFDHGILWPAVLIGIGLLILNRQQPRYL